MSQELERRFNEELREGAKRLAGEYAYVLAVKHRNTDQKKSRYYAQECLRIFAELDIQTLEDAIPRLGVQFDGILLPEYIHERVVRKRFEEMGIVL